MWILDIIFLAAIVWLLSDVQRLRARVSELEKKRSSSPAIGTQTAVPADVGISTGSRAAAVARDEMNSVAHRGPRVRGNDEGDGGPSAWERLAGGRLLIWVGGIALAAAGLFLVRYSIEVGLIGEGLRMALAAALGLALIGAGEWARVRVADDPRVAQALVGAGVLILYATAYGAHVLYGLLSLKVAFALMALIAVGGLGLSLRHGWPAAALGLVGAFVAPALLADLNSGAVPLLFYLLVVNITVLGLARLRPWTALLGTAAVGTACWTVPLAAKTTGFEALATGLFVALYAAAATLVMAGRARAGHDWAAWLSQPGRPLLLGLAQLALFTAAQEFGALGWALFLAASAFAILRSRGDVLPWMPAGAAVGATLLLGWMLVDPGHRADAWAVAAAIAGLFAAGALWRGRGDARPIWPLLLAIAAAGPALALRLGVPGDLPAAGWGALFLLLAALLLVAALRPGTGRVGLVATAATLAGVAVADLLPDAGAPAGWGLLAVGIALFARRTKDAGVQHVAAAMALIALLGGAWWFTLRFGAGRWPAPGPATMALALSATGAGVVAWATEARAVRNLLWAGAGAIGLLWAVVLAGAMSGAARVVTFLVLGGLLIWAGQRWSRGQSGTPARKGGSADELVGATGFEPATPTPPV